MGICCIINKKPNLSDGKNNENENGNENDINVFTLLSPRKNHSSINHNSKQSLRIEIIERMEILEEEKKFVERKEIHLIDKNKLNLEKANRSYLPYQKSYSHIKFSGEIKLDLSMEYKGSSADVIINKESLNYSEIKLIDDDSCLARMESLISCLDDELKRFKTFGIQNLK
jgi:hypothetical protein